MVLHITLLSLYWGVGDEAVTAYQRPPGDVFALA